MAPQGDTICETVCSPEHMIIKTAKDYATTEAAAAAPCYQNSPTAAAAATPYILTESAEIPGITSNSNLWSTVLPFKRYVRFKDPKRRVSQWNANMSSTS